MSKGRFGIHGGQYIPETLMNAIHELEEAYNYYKNDPAFHAELDELLKNYVGRPSLLYYADKMTKDLGGAKIYLKREDLNHTGSHKINNALAQCLSPRRWARPVLSRRPAPVSTVLQPQPLPLCSVWNAKCTWVVWTPSVRRSTSTA